MKKEETIKKNTVTKTSTNENAAKISFGICAAFSIIAVLAIVAFVFWRSIPAFREIGLINFLTGDVWRPSWEDRVTSGEVDYTLADIFGISPMILTTLALTACAAVLGSLLGIFTAVFMAYYCPKTLERVPGIKHIPVLRKFPLKGFFEQVINLLASIPSIVIGFFGVAVLLPFVGKFAPGGEPTGLFSATLILSIMIVPTIASLSKNSLEAVSQEYYEGSLGLGNSKDQTVFRVMFPAARSGIMSAIILGVGRAVGETMAVMFVIGNSSNMPDSFFKPIASLTTTIAKEMGYAVNGSIHQSALIAMGFILLLFVLLITGVLNFVKKDKVGGDKLFGGKIHQHRNAEKIYTYKQCGIPQTILKYVSIVFAAIVAVVLLFMIVFICIRGIPNLSFNFLFGESSNAQVTLAPAFASTFMIIFMTLLISLPLGIGAAIFLNEYSKKGSKFIKVVRLFIDALSGVPSIVFGLFGMIFFCDICKLGYSLWAGSFTMVLIVLPTIIRSTEESLREVPDSMREASLALGSSKVRTIFKIVLPAALRGIVTSIILSIGRIVGESAALIYTSGTTIQMPDGYSSTGATFSVFMYVFQQEGLHMNEMYATAVVLLVIVIILDVLVTLVQKKFDRKIKGDGGNAAPANEEKVAEKKPETVPGTVVVERQTAESAYMGI